MGSSKRVVAALAAYNSRPDENSARELLSSLPKAQGEMMAYSGGQSISPAIAALHFGRSVAATQNHCKALEKIGLLVSDQGNWLIPDSPVRIVLRRKRLQQSADEVDAEWHRQQLDRVLNYVISDWIHRTGLELNEKLNLILR